MTTLYHIKCSQCLAMTTIRTICDNAAIENYLFDGGIHLHLTPIQVQFAQDIATTFDSVLEIGMLPSAKQRVKDVMRRATEVYGG